MHKHKIYGMDAQGDLHDLIPVHVAIVSPRGLMVNRLSAYSHGRRIAANDPTAFLRNIIHWSSIPSGERKEGQEMKKPPAINGWGRA